MVDLNISYLKFREFFTTEIDGKIGLQTDFAEWLVNNVIQIHTNFDFTSDIVTLTFPDDRQAILFKMRWL